MHFGRCCGYQKKITHLVRTALLFFEIVLQADDRDQRFLDFHPVEAHAVGQVYSQGHFSRPHLCSGPPKVSFPCDHLCFALHHFPHLLGLCFNIAPVMVGEHLHPSPMP